MVTFEQYRGFTIIEEDDCVEAFTEDDTYKVSNRFAEDGEFVLWFTPDGENYNQMVYFETGSIYAAIDEAMVVLG